MPELHNRTTAAVTCDLPNVLYPSITWSERGPPQHGDQPRPPAPTLPPQGEEDSLTHNKAGFGKVKANTGELLRGGVPS